MSTVDKKDVLEQQIVKQQERLKQLKAKKQLIENRERSKQKEQERKEDTRRKILIGSCMLKLTENDEQANAKLLMQLERYLTEDRDRKLFNLEPLKNQNI